MEEYLIENTERYRALVDGHNLKAHKDTLSDKSDKSAVESDITIAGRIRPLLDDEVTGGQIPGVFHRPGSASTLDLHEMRRPVKPLAPPVLTSSSYCVDKVFSPDSATENIYEELVKPLVPWAWIGGVSTLFAYGQTGSGKTHTVSGLECLIAETLFSTELQGTRNIYVSVIELAGKLAFDLLNQRKPVSILEDSFGSTHFAGAFDLQVKDSATLRKHIEDAASFRRTEPTLKNNTSSRSHAICKIRLENPELPQAEDGVLYLIDLAGSEAARDKAAHSAERMKEAREINTSLSVLKDCIRGRASFDIGAANKPAYVPYRQSGLTRVLKHVFDPAAERACKTVVIACINPSFLDVGASKSTLRYAALLKGTPPKPTVIKYDPLKPSGWTNEQLKEWITNNSGSPAVSADLLAPIETGRQLLRLPAPEFITRCLQTEGVTKEQAVAFQSKFWGMHVDSGRSTTFKSSKSKQNSDEEKEEKDQSSTAALVAAIDRASKGLSSANTDPKSAGVNFKDRLRPGTVVSWAPVPGEQRLSGGFQPLPGRNLAFILAPESDAGKYMCSVVVPGILPGAFEVYLWQQVVVSVADMVAEVLLEYDVSTRYYYETV